MAEANVLRSFMTLKALPSVLPFDQYRRYCGNGHAHWCCRPEFAVIGALDKLDKIGEKVFDESWAVSDWRTLKSMSCSVV